MEELIKRLKTQPVVLLKAAEHEQLMASSDLLREEDTMLAGSIRILAIAEMNVVQERSPAGERYARFMSSREDADLFLENRLATYEKMWDGCGCKVDYTG
jgi:hypothetical protein